MTIDLQDMSSTYPILTHKHTLNPLWASDTGRNSNSGKYTGTFIGYFSSVVIEFGETTQDQMTLIRSKFDNSVISVKYKDSKTGSWKTEQFYGTAIEAKLSYWDGKYEPFSITLTAINKYS